MVVPGSVVVKAIGVVFAAGEIGCVVGDGATGSRVAVGRVGVRGLNRPGTVGERECAVKCVREESTSGRALCPLEELIHAEAGEQVGTDTGASKLLNGTCAVIEVACDGRTECLLLPPTECVICECWQRGIAFGDGAQLVTRVPVVRVGSVTKHVAVEVVAEGCVAPFGELIVGVVQRRADGDRKTETSVATRGSTTPTRGVVRVGEVADRCARTLVSEREQLARVVVTVEDGQAAGERE